MLDTAREWYLFRELAARRRGRRPVRDGRGPARRAHRECAGRGQGPLLQLRDHAPGRRRHPAGGAVRRLRVPLAHRGRPALAHRRVRGQSRPPAAGSSRGTEITHVDSGNGFVPMATVLAEDPNLGAGLRPGHRRPRARLPFHAAGRRAAPKRSFTKAVVTILPVPAGGAAHPRPALEPGRPGRLSQPAHVHDDGRGAAARGLRRFPGAGRRVLHRRPALQRRRARPHRRAHRRPQRRRRASDSDVFLRDARSTPPSPGKNSVRRFNAQPESVAPVRIAFITTGLTASASEIVINSLAPWTEVAIVGEDTLGKPVGQSGVRPLRLRPPAAPDHVPVHQRERRGRLLRGTGGPPALCLSRRRRPDARRRATPPKGRRPRRSPGWAPAPAPRSCGPGQPLRGRLRQAGVSRLAHSPGLPRPSAGPL